MNIQLKHASSILTAAVVLCIAIPGSSAASAPDCQSAQSDPDGDGWGWENHRSCRVDADNALTTESTASQPSPATNNSRHPSCTTTLADQDGDGWGWEFNRSCIIDDTSSSEATQPATPESQEPESEEPESAAQESEEPESEAQEPEEAVTPVAATNNRHPSCTTTDADTDGDGWGYEFGKSCLITVETQSGPATTPTPAVSQPSVAQPNNSRHPVCSSPAFDVDNDGWGYENHRSCIVIPETAAANGPTVTPPSGNVDDQNVGVIFSQSFSDAQPGLYQGDQLNSQWNSPLWHLGFDQGRVKIVTDSDTQRDRVMQVTYPAGAYGASGASAFLSDVQFGMDLPRSYNELYVAYDVKFDHNFEFVRGGKLPGLCGHDINQAPSTGCNTGGGYPNGYDGWSARGMWRENGALENYVYHANQANYYGDDEHWNVQADTGVWHRVQHRIVLNTVGQKNGILEAWIDGRKVLSKNTLEYRKTESVGINLFYFSTFFGGNDPSWAPSTDQRIFFDNFVISTQDTN